MLGEKCLPRPHALELHFLVDRRDRHALHVNAPAMGLGRDFLALIIEANIVVLHLAPVAPPERDGRRTTIDFQHLPRKRGHHALERLVRRRKVAVLG